MRSVGPGAPLHPDFGSGHYDGGPIGIPYATVGRRADEVPVRFRYSDESDPGPYPIPRDVPIEGGPDADDDRHALVIDRYRCRLYELFDAHPEDSGKRWRAGSGAVWRLDSNRLRPEGWTSADAAGLPIFPGLARHDEVREGEIDHALRFTVPESRRAFVYPARHFASDSNDPDLPAMGERFRLRQSFDVSGFPRQPRIVLRALKRYGMIVATTGRPGTSQARRTAAGRTTTFIASTRSGAPTSSWWTRAPSPLPATDALQVRPGGYNVATPLPRRDG